MTNGPPLALVVVSLSFLNSLSWLLVSVLKFFDSWYKDLVSILSVEKKEEEDHLYSFWPLIIIFCDRQTSDAGTSSQIYKEKKRNELLAKGFYRIVGNVGDQWSDLVGEHVGIRTFKVPNPMYYISWTIQLL